MKQTLFMMLAAVAACSSSPKAPKPEPTTGTGGEGQGKAEPFKIGAFAAYSLLDGTFNVPPEMKLWPDNEADVGAVLSAAGLPTDHVELSIHPLLVKTDGRVLLFDTGTGGAFPGTGLLPQSLQLAGVPASEVTDIFISHAHGDHVGGLVGKDGTPAFPAATIHISAPEWAAMQAADESKTIAAAVASKVVAFEPGAQILPEVRAVATQGHTVGHSSYEIVSGSDKLFYLGDVAHHSIVSVQRPAWSISFDGDKAAGQAMREKTLAALAADGERVFAVHFPFPGTGKFVTEGAGMIWQAD